MLDGLTGWKRTALKIVLAALLAVGLLLALGAGLESACSPEPERPETETCCPTQPHPGEGYSAPRWNSLSPRSTNRRLS